MKRQLIIGLLAIAAGFVAAGYLTRYVNANRVSLPEAYSDSDLDLQGRRLKGFALGSEGLLADWYWMRSLQYLGGKIAKNGLESVNLDDMSALNPRLLYPLLDNATTLDPKLMAAYSYGATILPAIDVQQAVELTEKGIRDNPDQWRLLQFLGYIHWKSKNYAKAAETYDRGAQIPNAPVFFKLMAAKMRSESGSRDTARAIYHQTLESATDKQTRLTAALRLQQLDSMDEMDIINRLLREHLDKTGACTATWRSLGPAAAAAARAAGRDLHVDAADNLVDPSGVPYRLNRRTCEAEIDWPKSKIPPPNL